MKNLKSKSAKRTNKMVAAAISATVTVLCLIVLGAAMFTENAVAKSKMDNVIVYSRGAEPGQLVQ